MKIGRLGTAVFVLGLVLAVGLLGFALVRRLPRSQAFPTLRRVAQLVAPPADLYVPLASASAQLGDRSWSAELRLLHRYPGAYAVNVETLPAPEFGTKHGYPIDFRMELVCRVAGSQQPVRLASTAHPGTWWKSGFDQGGFTLIRYTVPEVLPANESISCIARTATPGQEFQRSYPTQILTVQKESEE